LRRRSSNDDAGKFFIAAWSNVLLLSDHLNLSKRFAGSKEIVKRKSPDSLTEIILQKVIKALKLLLIASVSARRFA
jgi:hypothetical protein